MPQVSSDPGGGINAAVEVAHQILAIVDLAATFGADDPALGAPTITPTLVSAGSTRNTVPAAATVSVDVRVPSRAAQDRIDDMIRGLRVRLPGARVSVRGGKRRPPTLDGLGAVGSGAHSDSEHVDVAQMVPRSRLLAALISRTRQPPTAPGDAQSAPG